MRAEIILGAVGLRDGELNPILPYLQKKLVDSRIDR
jgi:hypothetical protein